MARGAAMTTYRTGRKHIAVCKLEDGREIEYDACSDSTEFEKKFYPADEWEYLGQGKIISIDGIKQDFKTIQQFWKRI